MSFDKKICQHATCTCNANPGSDYCCDECRLAEEREASGEAASTGCHCGHTGCGAVPEAPADVQALFDASQALAEA